MSFTKNEFKFYDLINLFINIFIINKNRKLTYRNKSIHNKVREFLKSNLSILND